MRILTHGEHAKRDDANAHRRSPNWLNLRAVHAIQSRLVSAWRAGIYSIDSRYPDYMSVNEFALLILSELAYPHAHILSLSLLASIAIDRRVRIVEQRRERVSRAF